MMIKLFRSAVIPALCLLVVAACDRAPYSPSGVSLTLENKVNYALLKITNNSETDLSLPADLVNGPRDTNASVFLIVQDERRQELKRCAIVEVEPERMRDVVVYKNSAATVTIPVLTLTDTYCTDEFRLQAVFGSLSPNDDVIPLSVSNVIELRPIVD